ncbi:hypothetical protein ACWKSP_10800 [Micromonosporaceae bacterium Da 78-11]
MGAGVRVAGPRIHVARDDSVIVVSRRRLRLIGGRPVHRPWKALVETTTETSDQHPRDAVVGTALVAGPPILAGALTAAFAPVEVGIVAGGAVFFAMSYLGPMIRGRLAKRGPRATGGQVYRLTTVSERAAFDRVLATADRISETWPGLGSLVDVFDAETMLADALWEIARVLARRQEVSAVLTELSRPDFMVVDPGDQTARELQVHRRAARTAMAQVEAELAQREANLRRVEQVGRRLSRELEMRRAIRAAEESLRAGQSPELAGLTSVDPAAELAEQTQSVLAAYRELTVAPTLDLPPAD